MNQYEQNCNQEPPFKVMGQDVVLMSPTRAKITIHCPWGRKDPVTPERQTFVMTKTENVVNYMLAEQLMVNGGSGVGIEVETEFHPQTKA